MAVIGWRDVRVAVIGWHDVQVAVIGWHDVWQSLPVGEDSSTVGKKVAHARFHGGGLYSFPFPLNLSLPCPFAHKLSLLCHPYNSK